MPHQPISGIKLSKCPTPAHTHTHTHTHPQNPEQNCPAPMRSRKQIAPSPTPQMAMSRNKIAPPPDIHVQDTNRPSPLPSPPLCPPTFHVQEADSRHRVHRLDSSSSRPDCLHTHTQALIVVSTFHTGSLLGTLSHRWCVSVNKRGRRSLAGQGVGWGGWGGGGTVRC